MPEKILVTGATGFIATHCIVDLLNQGYEVKGTIRKLDRENDIRAIFNKYTKNIENLEIAKADLTDPNSWEEATASGVRSLVELRVV